MADRSEIESFAMDTALAAASRGYPAPNPHVGCVIVADGGIVGIGWHEYAGGDHAEVAALKEANERARGGTAFVTLEPCNHFGRTPPCSLALIEAGVARVVIGAQDPNPRAQGGADRLREAGIEVEFDEEFGRRSQALNHRFHFAMTHGRPEVTLKAAVSLDGRIALPSGESKWITGAQARRAAHALRAECGAVLVGRRTVELDDPHLTVREVEVRNQPLRVVLDPKNQLPTSHRVFDDAAETWHVTGEIDLARVMSRLRDAGHIGLLVEGGGTTIAGFVRAGLADRFALFMAPKLLGEGPSWVESLGLPNLAKAPQLRFESVDRLGDDLLVRGAFE